MAARARIATTTGTQANRQHSSKAVALTAQSGHTEAGAPWARRWQAVMKKGKFGCHLPIMEVSSFARRPMRLWCTSTTCCCWQHFVSRHESGGHLRRRWDSKNLSQTSSNILTLNKYSRASRMLLTDMGAYARNMAATWPMLHHLSCQVRCLEGGDAWCCVFEILCFACCHTVLGHGRSTRYQRCSTEALSRCHQMDDRSRCDARSTPQL